MASPERSEMEDQKDNFTDAKLENTIGYLLRYGVLLAAAVVLFGGILYLIKYGTMSPDYINFKLVSESLRSIEGILAQAFKFQPGGLIQLGLLLLIATPIARVILSVVAFLRQRDFIYAVITLIVLLILIFSFFALNL